MADKKATIAETVESTRTYAGPAWLKESPDVFGWADQANSDLFNLEWTPALDEKGRRLVDPHTEKPLSRLTITVTNAMYFNEKLNCMVFVDISKYDKKSKRVYPQDQGTLNGKRLQVLLQVRLAEPFQQRAQRDLGTISI